MVGINLQRKSLSSILDVGILGEWALIFAIEFVVEELSRGVTVKVTRGDVVTNSDHASGFSLNIGDGPSVVGGFRDSSCPDVTELVFSVGSWDWSADRGWDTVWLDQLPSLTKLDAVSFIVGELSFLVFGASDFGTDALGFHVKALRCEKVAFVGVIGVDGNVSPWVGVPVRIVVPFFWDFKTVAVTIFVLACLGGSSLVADVSVSDPQSLVSLSILSGCIVFKVFVHTETLLGNC